MSGARLSRRDVLWGYLGQFMNLAAGLLLLPLLVTKLAPEVLGLWFVFLTMVSLSQLVELGLQPTLARSAAYVHSGVRSLLGEGVHAAPPGSTMDAALLHQLAHAGRRAYRWVSAGVALALFAAGGAYVHHLQATNPQVLASALPAWIAYAAGYVISTYFGWYNAFLLGRGDVAQHNQVIVATKGSFLLFSVFALLSDLGLMGLGLASLLSCVASRLLARYFYRRGVHAPNLAPVDTTATRTLAATLWPNAWKLSLVQLGSFLIVRGNTLVASAFLGLAVVASYGLMVQLLLVLAGLASLMVTLQLPRMNAAQARQDREGLRRALGLALVSAWLVFAVGASLLGLAGDAALALLGKDVRLVAPALMALMLLIAFMEVNHSIAAQYLTTLNRVPFAAAAIVSGVAIVLAGALLCGPLGWDLLGLVLAQGLVQMAYNNWKWPLEAMRDLAVRPGALLRLGVVELARVSRGR